MVEIKRQQVDVVKALRQALPTLSLGKHLDEAVRQGFNLHRGDEIVEKGYGDLLSEFLARRLPWRTRTP